MKRARQHGRPVPAAGEEVERGIRDAELDVTGRHRARGEASDVLSTNRQAQEKARTDDRER